jgi:hypothetical protein
MRSSIICGRDGIPILENQLLFYRSVDHKALNYNFMWNYKPRVMKILHMACFCTLWEECIQLFCLLRQVDASHGEEEKGL